MEVVLANPKTGAIAEARLKNPRDARTLADLLRADLVAPSRRSTQRDKGIEKPDQDTE